MKRKAFSLALAFALALASGVSAQVALGWTGTLHENSDVSAAQVAWGFGTGQGVFYGPTVELAVNDMSFGAAFSISQYLQNFGTPTTPSYTTMVDWDVSAYAQAHIFGYRSFIDPFVEAGIGMIAKDYANPADDPDGFNPLQGTCYWQAGGGLGLNFGHLGFFSKVLYQMPIGPMYANAGYPLEEYHLTDIKACFGAKLIF